jgi:hypothetical protein
MVQTGSIKFKSEEKWRQIEYRETVDGIRILRPDSEIQFLNGVIGVTVEVQLQQDGPTDEYRVQQHGSLVKIA